MPLAQYTQLSGATMGVPTARSVSLNASNSAILRNGGFIAWFNPAATVDSVSPLSIPDAVGKDWRFNSLSPGESPGVTTLTGLKAYSFDGTNDAVDLININGGAAQNVIPLAASYSVIMVVRPDNLTGNQGIIGATTSNGTGIRVRLMPSGEIRAYHGATEVSGTVALTGNTRLSAGQTSIVAMSYDATADTLAAWVDGQKGAGVGSAPPDLNDGTLQIGNYEYGSHDHFDGFVGDVFVLDWALQDAAHAARRVNLLSAIASKWSVTLLA